MILLMGPGGCGFTFLSWTISFLRGDTAYTTVNGVDCPVDINPLDGVTAHNFNKDHTNSRDLKIDLLELGHNKSIIYVTITHQDDLSYILKFPGKKIIFQNTCEYSEELFARMCLAVPNNPYMPMINNFDASYDKTIVKQVFLESNKLFTDYYQIPHHDGSCKTITYPELFTTLDEKINEIFDHLNLTISEDRYAKWQTIYNQYRLNNTNFKSKFLPETVPVDNSTRLKILKKIIK